MRPQPSERRMRRMRIRRLLALLAMEGAGSVLAPAEPAWCVEGCLPTFCGYSSECPGGCVCAIPLGRATGYCARTR